MGTGTYDEIYYTIKGTIHLDLTDEDRPANILKKELELLCARYGLELEEVI